MLLWAFIGYLFTLRYVGADETAPYFGALVAMFIIVQIERTIILSPRKSKAALWFRGALAICMAILGALVIDQMILSKDIEKQKNFSLQGKIETVFQNKSNLLKIQRRAIDSTLKTKEEEMLALRSELMKSPLLRVTSTKKTVNVPGGVDSLKNETLETTRTNIVNPNDKLLSILQGQIDQVRLEKVRMDSVYLGLRREVEHELKSNVGFLEEFDILLDILRGSTSARIVWILWCFIILVLESFVLTVKFTERENDYDRALEKQMDLQFKRIALLAEQ